MPVPNHLHKETVDEIIKLLNVITKKSEFITIFYSVLEGGSEYDLFAKAILSYAHAAGTTMDILQNVVQSEFEANVGTPTSIMRGNTAASRILGLFCRQEGQQFLKKQLSPSINSIAGGDISFEIDHCKLSGDIPAQKKVHLDNLLSFAECVLSTISTPESILDMPRKIKALAFHIQRLATEHSPENTMLLVGGFVMLRFINPALLTPDFYGLVESGSLSMTDRRNLTLLCKLIQNISNQRICNEDWMLDCNPFIEKNMHRLEEFYVHVLMDPIQENDDQEPFGDLFDVKPTEELNPEAVDLEAYKFFHDIFVDRKSDLLEIFGQQDDVLRSSKDAMKLVELLNDYGEVQLPEVKVELYYSPLCPFSRAVWLFCLETQIPIVTHKIDLLKEDQALDQEYKKFSQISPSLQVPLLHVDGEFVLEESSAICMYLCDRFVVGNHWLPKAELQSVCKIHQQIDWMQHAIQIPVLRLWNSCKDPTAENLQLNHYKDFVSNLEILDTAYGNEKERCNQLPTTPYFQGKTPSLVDLFTILILSFGQLIQGFTVNKFPNLKLAYYHFVNQYAKKHWKEINYEFEGFFKYVITATSTGSIQQIKQSVLFQQTPHTIYEMVQDPENDIFLFLASKTISTKTNAKLKRGLKKLNTDGAQPEQPADENDEAPYIVNLDIGGEFNIRGREGTNLLLVPGKKIVQTSRMSDWEAGYISTVIFEFETTANSQALLHFTELNCPSENSKMQEDHWIKFWKKINGVRVDTIDQTIVLKTKGPEMLFNILTDWRLLSKTLKSKMKFEENGGAYMHNNKVYANITSTVPNKRIVQDWRCVDWPEDLFGRVEQDLEGYEGGCRIHNQIHMVPYDRVKTVEKLWKSNMWKKLGGIVCTSLEQNIAFLIPPSQVCAMLLDGTTLSSKLKNKCVASPDTGSQFIAGHLKGTVMRYEEEKRIVLCVSHKDWPNHNSLVTMNMKAVENGTEVHMLHENIPLTSIKSISDMWNSDFWDKLDGIQTTNIQTSCILNTTSPEILYMTLLDKNALTKIVGSDSSISPKVGGPVAMYDKVVKGGVTSLEVNTSIGMSIRYFNWPFGHQSQTHFQFDEINGGKGTVFTLQQNRVPINQMDDAAKNCEELCKQLKKYKFNKK